MSTLVLEGADIDQWPTRIESLVELVAQQLPVNR